MSRLTDWFRRSRVRPARQPAAAAGEVPRCEWCGDPLPRGRTRFCSSRCEFGDEFWRES